MRTGYVTAICFLVLTCLSIGCASSGNNYDSGKVSEIKKGQTTEAELVKMFGNPEQRTIDSDGNTHLLWRYSEARANGKSFIPYYGMFAGGTDTSNKTLMVTLKDGIVQNFTSSEGASGTRHGTQSVPD